MDSDDDSNNSSSGSTFQHTEFTPFTPHLALRDLKSQTTLSLLSSILTTAISLEIPHLHVDSFLSTKIGEGATYYVDRARLAERPRPWVAKKNTKFTVPKAGTRVHVNYVEDPSLRRRIKSVLLELQILSHPSLKNHPNFVKLLGYSWEEVATGYSPAVIVELAEFGSLDEFATSGLSWAEKKILCDDIVVGLDALHACGIAHGDVKPDNVLVFKHHERRFIAKLSDFEHALLGVDVVKYGGTPIYNAPEVHLQDHPSEKVSIPLRNFPLCDVFSFGLSVFEIFCNGKRYYRNEYTRPFRDLLLNFDHDKGKILELALEFLGKTEEFPLDISKICKDVFQETLCFSPTGRLKGGWGQIRELIGAETFLFSAKKSQKPPPQLSKHHQQTDYSILSFYINISLASDSIQSEISAELRYRAIQSFLPSEDRGKAAFQLCFCSAVGFGQDMNPQDSANWLSQAALLGYEPALTIGARIMEANDLPIPDVFFHGSLLEESRKSIEFLKDLPQEDYYLNAVRIFWGGELRKMVQIPLNVEGDVICALERNRFLEWFNAKRISHGQDPTKLSGLIDCNFLLHHSAAIGDTEISRLLIQSGGTINLVNSENQTPLYLACRGGNSSVVKMLLSNTADPTIGDTNGVTPLHWIVLFPTTEIDEISKLLVSHGANPNAETVKVSELHFDNLGLSVRGSPLHWACYCQNRFAVQHLLSLGADPTLYTSISSTLPNVVSPLICALGTLNANIAEILISTGRVLEALSEDRRARLYPEIGGASGHDFQRWIIHGKGYRQAYMPCVDLLLRHGIPLNGYMDPPKSTKTNVAMLMKLIRPAPKTEKAPKRYIPIHGAALRLNVNLVKALSARGARLSERDPQGETALHHVLWAAFDIFRHTRLLETTEALLQGGATLEEDPETGSGRPASSLLMTACRFDIPLDVIRILLSRGGHAMVNSLREGQAPLHLCHDDPNVIGLLQEFGADINLESEHMPAKEGQADIRPIFCCMTAAGKALSSRHWEYFQTLLDKGITLIEGTTGDHQHTLLHLAVQIYHSDIARREYNSTVMETNAKFFEKVVDYPVIQEGKLINILDWAGFTPLKYAIWFAMPKCVEILLSRGALVDGTSSEITARMVADEFYLNPPYFIEEDDDAAIAAGFSLVDQVDTTFGWPRQWKSEYRRRLKEVISIIDDNDKTITTPFSHLSISH